MARVVSEKLWTSEKLRNVQPKEWRSEYSWLLPIATADGTFECLPHLVWAQAYAFCREDWSPKKVGQLLDEFARVGLLQRTQDEDGKVWGRWTGSEKFLPSKERCKTNRYKTGRGDLFNPPESSDGVATAQRPDSDGAAPAQRPVGVGVGVGLGTGEGTGVGLVCAAKNSENGQRQEQPQEQSVSFSSSKATPTPHEQPQRQRQVLSPDEYRYIKGGAADATARSVAELAAEIMARPDCPACGKKHPPLGPGDKPCKPSTEPVAKTQGRNSDADATRAGS